MSNREVMQQALEALEYASTGNRRPEIIGPAITALHTALEQPEQEPVAWTTMPKADDWDFVSGSKDPTGKLEGKWFPLYTTPPAEQPKQQAEPVAMRMPEVGDKVICLEDESLGTVESLTAGGSPDIKFDDGSHGTYLLREFAELFGYVAPPQPQAEPSKWRDMVVVSLVREGIDKHRARELADHFATPLQRPWVGLTPEEILDLFDRNNVYGSKWIEFARTVEAKLKEKNDH
jgi:hypothetical protein